MTYANNLRVRGLIYAHRWWNGSLGHNVVFGNYIYFEERDLDIKDFQSVIFQWPRFISPFHTFLDTAPEGETQMRIQKSPTIIS